MKKYLFIIPSLSKGGAERVVSNLANELVKRNCDVYIVFHFYSTEEYEIDSRVKKICLSEMYELNYRKKFNIFYFIKLLVELRRQIIKITPDFIIPFLWTTCLRTEFSLIFSRYKKRIIHTVRNNPEIFPNNKFMKLLRNFYINNSKLTIVQNSDQKEYFKNKGNIEILKNPVSNEIINSNFINKKDNTMQIVGVGRLEKQKNFKLLIDAVANVKKAGYDVSLEIYGDGSLKNVLQEQINTLKMNEFIKLCGRSNSYYEIYSNKDLFILSSDFEGMPNTLLEAMACGIPCISTRCKTGPEDIIEDYVDGILVKINNLDELEEKIIELYNNTELRNKIGVNAKYKIKNEYSPDVIADNFIRICDTINNKE